MHVAFCTQYPISAVFGDEVTLLPGEHPFPWVRLLAKELIRGGHVDALDILTTSAHYPHDEVVERPGNPITYRVFSWRDDLELPLLTLRGHEIGWARGLWRMVRCLRRLRPDVVHAHGTDDIHALAAVFSGRPHVISIQGLMTNIARVYPTPRSAMLQRMERLALRRARAINAKTAEMAAQCRALGPKAAVYEVEDPVNELFFAHPIPAPRPVVHFVGEVLPRKGVQQWLEAFIALKRRFPALRGRIVGQGPTAIVERLKRSTAEAGISDALEFAGARPHADISAAFAQGGVFCLPSLTEHCPNAIMEAMAAGLPVVATRVGDVPGIVEDEGSGLLVATADPLLVEEAVGRILEAPNWHRRLGQRGRAIAAERWTASRCAEAHTDLYGRL